MNIMVILHNPYHAPDVLIARIAVNFATIIWSAIVLANVDSLAVTRYGALLTYIVPEDWTAWLFLALSSVLIYRIVAQSPPNRAEVAGYGTLVVAWGFIEYMLLLSPGPLQPTPVAWTTPGFVLALYSFVATGKAQQHVAGV